VQILKGRRAESCIQLATAFFGSFFAGVDLLLLFFL